MSKQVTVKHSGGTTYDVVNFMKKQIKISTVDPYIYYLAQKLKQYPKTQQLQKVYLLARYAARFKRDPEGHQQIRSAKALIEDKNGNCVDYSIMISSFLCLLKIPHSLRLISESEKSGFIHVFVVTKENIYLDAILGQPGSNTEQWFEDLPEGHYNKQVPEYYDKLDIQIL